LLPTKSARICSIVNGENSRNIVQCVKFRAMLYHERN